MHETLILQLIKHFGSLDRIPENLKPFLEEVSDTYAEGLRRGVRTPAAANPDRLEYSYAGETEAEKGGNGHSGSRVAIPIQLRGQTLGAINLDFADQDSVLNTVPLVQQLSNRLALAMDNARLFQETQESLSRTNALLAVSRAAIGSESTTELLNTTARVINETLSSDRVVIRRLDTRLHQVLEAVGAGPGVQHSPLDLPFDDLMDGIHGWVLRERKSAISPKNTLDPRDTERSRSLRVLSNCGAILIIPLLTRDTVVGMITVINTPEEPDFTPGDEELLSAMASQITTALENAQLLEARERQLEELSVLFEGSRIFTTAPTDLVEASTVIARYFMEISGANSSAVGFYRPEDEYVYFLAETTSQGGVAGQTPDPSIWNYHLAEYPFTRRVLELRTAAAVSLTDSEIDPAEKQFLIDNNVQTLVIVPLASKGQTIGVIELEYQETPRAVSSDQLRYYETLANQAAATLDNLQLLRAQEQRALELQTAAEVSRAASSILDVETLIGRTVELIRDRFSLYYAGIFLVDPAGEWAVLRAGTGDAGRVQLEQRHRLQIGGQSMIGRSISTGVAQIALDVGAAAVRFQNPILPETRSEMALPLISRGERLGAMTIQSTRPAAFTDQDVATLQTMADQLANAIENARLFAQAQLQARELAVLNEMGRSLTADFDRTNINENILRYTGELMDFNSFLLAYYDREKDQLTFPVVIENNERLTIPDQTLGSGLVAYLVRNRTHLLIPENLAETAESLGIFYTTVGEKTESWLGVPILVQDEVIAVISVQSSTTPRLYNERSRDLLISIANQAANAIQISNLFEQARQQANELAVLNEMSRALSIQLDLDDVIQNIYDYSARLIGTANLFVATYDKETQEIDFRIAVNDDGERLDVPSRKIGSGLTDSVIISRTALLFKENAEAEIQRLGLEGITIGDPPMSWLAVPILLGDEVIGVIGTQSTTTPRMFTERHRELLNSIAGQAAISMQNAAYFSQAQRQSEDLLVLNEMGRELATLFDTQRIVERVYSYTSMLMDTGSFFVAFYDEAIDEVTLPLVYSAGELIESMAPRTLGQGLTDYVLRNKTPLLLTHFDQEQLDELGIELILFGNNQPAQSWLGVPLLIGENLLGAVVVQSVSTAGLYRERHRDLLTSIANQASSALQNARLFNETQKRAAQLQTAAEVAREASQSLNLDELLPRAVNLIRERFGFYHASIFLLDDSRENAYVRASTGEAGRELITRRHSLAVGSKSIIGSVTFTGTPLVVNDVTRDAIHRPNPLLPETRAELGIPLKIGERVIGALDVQSTSVTAFDAEDVSVLQTLADQIAVAVDNSRTFELAQEAFREARERAQEMTSLFDVSRQLTASALEVQEVAETTARAISDYFGPSTSASIALLDRETDVMQVVVDQEIVDEVRRFVDNPAVWNYMLDEYPATRAAMESLEPRIFQIDDPNLDADEKRYMESVDGHTLLVVPLAIKGQALGVLEIESWDEQRSFTQSQVDLAVAVANLTAAALENALLYTEQIRTAEQLRELDTLKNQFLANMSHELRTPLNSIIGFSRVILKGIDGPVTDLQQQDLNAIYNAGQHLLGLINDILDLSRIEAGKMELNFEELNIESLVNSVMATTRGLVKEKPIVLESSIEPDLPPIQADATRIRQILLNLLQNAAKFTETGSIRVEAAIEANPQGVRFIKVSVTDTGIGISEEDQKRLFQPFTQVDSSTTRKAGGTGLGLSISRNLIDLHGGEIGVESEVGKGSTFYFTLPIRQAYTIEVPDGEQKVVLAIDDDPRVIDLYRRYLDSQGYRVVAVQDPTRAVEEAIASKPFAITLDVMMPSKNGWQVIQDLKANPETRDIPVIFCTMIEDEARGFSLGAADYLLKPILEEDLINALVRLEADHEIQTVLVIDDSPDSLRLIEKILKPTGLYDLILAEGGKKGMEALKAHKPDVVLLDLLMDDLDGFKILENLQQDDETRDIPVIVVTGYELDEIQHETISSYAYNLVRKGNMKEEALIDKIAEILNRRRQASNGHKNGR